MLSYSRLLLLSLLVLAALVTVSARRRKTPKCKERNIPGTQRVCNPDDGTYNKGTVCTWTCNAGCRWTGGPKTRTCRGRPGVWKKFQRSTRRYQKSKGIQCSCQSCSQPGDLAGFSGHSCTGSSSYGAGTVCTYECPAGTVGTASRMCYNGNWITVGEDQECEAEPTGMPTVLPTGGV